MCDRLPNASQLILDPGDKTVEKSVTRYINQGNTNTVYISDTVHKSVVLREEDYTTTTKTSVTTTKVPHTTPIAIANIAKTLKQQ